MLPLNIICPHSLTLIDLVTTKAFIHLYKAKHKRSKIYLLWYIRHQQLISTHLTINHANSVSPAYSWLVTSKVWKKMHQNHNPQQLKKVHLFRIKLRFSMFCVFAATATDMSIYVFQCLASWLLNDKQFPYLTEVHCQSWSQGSGRPN